MNDIFIMFKNRLNKNVAVVTSYCQIIIHD